MIVKSKTDHRIYRFLTLSNSIKCLLICDKQTEYSAASIDLNVGSLSDPKEFPGLAHFCEHMLFMGTKKYPSENEYSEFIKNHGGSENAYTSTMHTNYYFSIANANFSEALQRFSEFFKEPLFCPEMVEREVQAINSEYLKDLPSDFRKIHQVVISQANKENCINRFTCGNIDTLSKEGVRNELIKYYQQNYSSNLMTMVLMGNYELDTLEKYAHSYFEDIKNLNIKPLDTSLPKPFDKSNLAKLYRIVPTSSKHVLKLQFLFPDTSNLYKLKPTYYITELLAHEGKNSLLSLLISQNFATELYANIDRMEANVEFLVITIILTENGLENYEKIMSMCFDYIRMMQSAGINEDFFNEIKQMQQLCFDYMNQSYPLSLASQIAGNLHRFNPVDILSAPYLIYDFSPDLIMSLMKLMTPDNMLAILISPLMSKYTDSLEKWYKTPYQITDLPKFRPSSPRKFKMPYPNTFIPRKVDLLVQNPDMPIYPKLVKETEKSLIYYKQDHKFNVPKAYGYCRIYTNDNDFPVNPEACIYLRLYLLVLYEDLREMIYMANSAGMNCSLSVYGDRLVFKFSGFNNSLKALVDSFLQKLCDYKPAEHESDFETYKATDIKNAKSYLKSSPHGQASDEFFSSISSFGIDTRTKLQILEEKINFKDFVKYADGWLKSAKFNWFIGGNLLEKDAVEIAENAEKRLCASGKIIKNNEIRRQRIIELPPKTEFVFTQNLANSEETNSCLNSVFQYKPYANTELHLFAKNVLLFNIMKEPAFDILRTKSQLGYIVQATSFSYCRVLGGSILVQSDKMAPEKLYGEINNFLSYMKEKLNEMSEEEFKDFIEAAIVPYRQECINLSEECDEFWAEIVNGESCFEENKLIIKELEKLKKSDIIAYFNDMFFTNVKRFDYELVCQNHIAENNEFKESNKKDANLRGNIRIELEKYDDLRKSNKIYPDMFMQNNTKITALQRRRRALSMVMNQAVVL